MKGRFIVPLVAVGVVLLVFASILPEIEEIIKDENQDGDYDWDEEAAKKKEQFENA